MNERQSFVIKKKRGFFDLNSKEKATFIIQSLGVFFVIFAALFVFGFIPTQWQLVDNNVVLKPENNNENNNNVNIIENTPDTYTRPDRVYIPSVNIDTVVNKPDSQNVSALDQSLQSGAVHYPGSGSVESGNMFIFGHSTNWAVVRNQAYKTFNGLEKLQKGDEIFVEAGGQTYIYEVEYVELVDEDEALIDLSGSEKRLTISTCNSFGQKQERWVAHASFVRQG